MLKKQVLLWNSTFRKWLVKYMPEATGSIIMIKDVSVLSLSLAHVSLLG